MTSDPAFTRGVEKAAREYFEGYTGRPWSSASEDVQQAYIARCEQIAITVLAEVISKQPAKDDALLPRPQRRLALDDDI